MPTTTNPVSSVPVSNASQSKSLRTRLGFGGNTNKPSFFTQLNLKPSRRSFTMQPENESQDKTILLISTGAGNGSRSMTMSAKTSFNSLSKATTMHSRIPQRKVTHDSSNVDLSSSQLSNSRIQLNTPVMDFTSVRIPKTQLNANPNDSATSKDLPNLPNDLSLLVNEPCPSGPTISQKSQESVVHIGPHSRDSTSRDLNSPPLTSSNSVRASTETHDSRLDEFEVDDSFDLSKARISLESLKEGLKNRWSHDMIVQDTSFSNTDTSAPSLDVSDASSYHNRSGPITSTPFVSRKVTPSQILPEPSFDLDTLDPDLVALLRPNSFQETLDRVSTPAQKRPSQSTNLPPVRTSAKAMPNKLESPPVSPSHFKYNMDTSSTRRFSKTVVTLPTPPSPNRPGHSTHFQLSQQTPALSHAPKPTIALNRIPWLDSPESEAGLVSSGPSTVSSSNLATPLDISKPPSPLVSHHPIISNDQQCRPEPFVVNRSSYFNSRNGEVQIPAQSSLPSSFEPKPNPRFALKNIDVQLASSLPLNETFDEVGMPKGHYLRNQTLDAVRNGSSRPSSADPSHLSRLRGNSSAGIPHSNERSGFESRRHRKRSMSVDQSPDLSQLHHCDNAGAVLRHGSLHTRKPNSARYDGKSPVSEDHGQRESPDVGGERERQARLSPEWLGPRTVKAFAAAGLLNETRETDRHIFHTRSISEYKVSAALNRRDRFSADGFSSMENERDRDTTRHSLSNRHGDYKPSGMRSGAATSNVNGYSNSRPLSRADSLSNPRPAPLFVRTISDLVSGRGSMEGRDSLGSSGSYPRTISGYSVAGGTRSESTGSGGRLSPTTSSSHITVQSQLQSMKEKYDSQTEALLAALADSQKSCRELRTENGSLKNHVKELEERLIEAISAVKQKEKELTRARRLYANDRLRITNGKNAQVNGLQTQAQSQPFRSQTVLTTARSVSPPKTRRFSNGSSIFPTIPNTMALLMAETPDGAPTSSPPPETSGSGASPPPSPTLVLPKLIPESNVIKTMDNRITSSPVTIPHRRSTSITSLATSANLSINSGSPVSLKLKPEHEFLLGDLTQISLLTGSGTESEIER